MQFIKHLINLRDDRHYRKEKSQVLIMGRKLVKELSPLEILIVEEGSEIPQGVSAKETHTVSHAELKKITALISPEPYAAVVKLPSESHLRDCTYLLILDGVSDPGNMGTLLRTALGLGWDGVFITQGSCDPFNDKVIRAAKGASFRLPFRSGSWSELSALLKDNRMQVYVADAKGKDVATLKFNAPLALILSNESLGVSQEGRSVGTPLSIPMKGKMESLNVASAGAILLYEIR